MRLLLAEDDAALGESLRRDLQARGYAVDWMRDGLEALHMGSVESYDVVVLDLGLPQRPGLDVLRRWRAEGRAMPVLILTARDAWHEKVDGFNAGADDYLGKPFHFEELAARLSALTKRGRGNVPQRLGVRDWVLDEERQVVVYADGREELLTAVEFRILRCFLLRPNRVLSKSWLYEHIYEADHAADSNVIEVYINRLRRKFGTDLIATRRGQGYVLQPPVAG
jgi:DNA-binding response OmpR family regulator